MMCKAFQAIVLIAGLTMLVGAPRSRAAAQIVGPDGAPRITQAEFKKLHAAGNVIVVDTRSEQTFRSGRIPGAIVLPLEGLQTFPAQYEKTIELLKAAKQPIVTYCA